MADENNTPEGGNVPENTPQPTEHEVRASEQGWVPKDEWTGNPDDWRPAKEFLDRGELFKKIDEQKRELKQIKQAMEEFGKHHARVRDLEFKRAIDHLKAQKKEALEAGDADAVVEIDDKIAAQREAQKQVEVKPQPQAAEPNQDFVRWQARNPWYGTDRAMKAVADTVAQDLVGRGESDPVRILQAVDREIRKEFPHKFENPNRQRAGAVEGNTKGARAAPKDHFELTDFEKRIMERIVSTGAITKEKYIEELKATRAKGA